jgi:hypothetical protein
MWADLILAEFDTPTGQIGPLDAAYRRAAGGVWHSVLGALMVAPFGIAGLAPALCIALAYWLVKERADLRRGGKFWDGIEDALCVSLGAWYGFWWWPLAICAAGVIILGSAAVRARP